MTRPIELLGTYLHLARASQLRRRPHVRDRLLVLAGSLAARLDLPRIAAFCRVEILANNPRHMISRWRSLGDAQSDFDFQHLLRQLQRHYSLENSERLLASLGIDNANERNAYYSDEEYAAALLGTTMAVLNAKFGESSENA